MDSYRVIDNIQVEKANALARYKRLNNFKKMFRLMEFLVVIGLISWSTSYVPDGFKVFGGYIYACSGYILNQHVVFLLGNFIVLLCYVLSGQTENNATESVADSATNSLVIRNNVTKLVVPQGFENNYAKYETSETVSEVVHASLPVVDNLPQMKETVVEESESKIVENEDVIVKTQSEVAAEEAIKQADRQIKRFNRTQSARLKREMSMRPCRELRRSVTDHRRKSDADSTVDHRRSEMSMRPCRELRMSVTDHRRKSDVDSTVDRRKCDADSTVDHRRKSDVGSPVDRLSNEEFRLTIEAFILHQRSIIKEQAMVEQSY